MFARRVGDDGAIDLRAIEGDCLDALLDGDVVVGLTELTADGVVGSSLRQTRIDTDTIVVGLDTQDEL